MQAMRIVSINRGSAESIEFGQRHFLTGIRKRSVGEAVSVGQCGVDNDTICDTEHHGGPDQAVYAYAAEAYRWWARELGMDVEYGTFGENLTIAGFEDDLHVGDRLLIGDLILEATAPRIPCSTLAAQMQDEQFGLKFREAERPGVYFRVLNAGEVSPGDPVTLVETPVESISILEIFRIWYQPNPSPDDLRRLVAAPVSIRARERFESKLAAVEASLSGN